MKWKTMIAALFAGVAAAALLAACGTEKAANTAGTGDAKTVRIAIQPSTEWLPLWYAKDTGELEKTLKEKGITVKWTEFESGPPMNESFAAGQQDIGISGGVPVISLLAKGQKNVIVAQGSSADHVHAVVVGKDSGITDVQGLKGKKIGLTIGSSAHQYVYSLLKKHNLSIKDVEIVNISAGDAETALLNKQVDAVAFWQPNVTFLVDKKVGTALPDEPDIPYCGAPIFATEAYVKQNQDVVKAVLSAYAKAAKEIKADPAKAAAVLAPHFHASPEQMKTIIEQSQYPVKISDGDIKGLEDTVAFMKSIGIIKKDINIKDYIDTSLAEGL
ncbi:ABC transporter substrate-binding protein [uncultured Megasphaera sp.]|uniref:ABC transporter substrate-binding protein n=1 Tax=uncultured Megasphaera sp. TaxID=165188 RepID=UPI0026593A51|nr:aliphatic sulfonate ABC transporter substrate-binding protein [uncultured Megasphaera sp.]